MFETTIICQRAVLFSIFQRPKGSLESSRNNAPKRTRLGWVVRLTKEDRLGGSEHHKALGMKDRNKPSWRQFPRLYLREN